MRYILQFALAENTFLDENNFIPSWVFELLPEYKKGNIETVTWDTFTYITDDKSIVEANWDRPFYYDDEYFIFIGGHIFYRIKVADNLGRYVPTPEEVLKTVLTNNKTHYDIFKGNYHIIIYNRIRRTVIVLSSPLSLYPAWYIIQDGILSVSNLLESLLNRKKELSVNPGGLIEFTLFDHSLGSHTIYQGVSQLEGGHVLSISENGISDELVYDIRRWITKKPSKRKESLNVINDILKRHISEYTKSVNKFNISLTGGFDGRLNFSFIKKADYPRLQAFSYGMKGSLQLSIPLEISKKLNFRYKEVFLDGGFKQKYPESGMAAIKFSGGITAFIRANYPYGYGKISTFSRNCILGQCDMIRPLYTNPAGAIFNNFSHEIFYNESPSKFYDSCRRLSGSGFLDERLFTHEIIEKIYHFILDTYILPYPDLSDNERYYLFLMKESMLKFWQTECHIVDLFVNDFISFSDLDYIEALSGSEYFGLYKGIFVSGQFKRRKGQDLYADLMYINNNALNDIVVDRYYKPKWIRRGLIGYLIIGAGKFKANQRKKKIGNDTFADSEWAETFYEEFKNDIHNNTSIFNLGNLMKNSPYQDNNSFRYARHISLKLWLQYMGII
jgi:hypothetical protein